LEKKIFVYYFKSQSLYGSKYLNKNTNPKLGQIKIGQRPTKRNSKQRLKKNKVWVSNGGRNKIVATVIGEK